LDQDDHDPIYIPKSLSRGFDNEADADVSLDISSGDTAVQNTQITFMDRGTPVWVIRKDTSSSLTTIASGSGNAVMILSNSAAASTIVADAASNVGIGTATPATKLHVLGSARIEGTSLRIDNNADADTTVTIDSGSTAPQHSHFVFASQGADKWLICKDQNEELFIQNLADPSPIITFKGGNVTDLDTTFTKASTDAHASRHAQDGPDPLFLSAFLGAGNEVGPLHNYDPGGSSEDRSWQDMHSFVLDFTGRGGDTTICLWTLVQCERIGDSYVHANSRIRIDGVTVGLETGNGSSSRTPIFTLNSQWFASGLDAGPHTFLLEAREDNDRVKLKQGMFSYLDLGVFS
jgi:hypothetical protein